MPSAVEVKIGLIEFSIWGERQRTELSATVNTIYFCCFDGVFVTVGVIRDRRAVGRDGFEL